MKLSAVSEFLPGAGKGILALIIGLTVAVLVMNISRKVNKTEKSEPFPLVPFLAFGVITAFLL